MPSTNQIVLSLLLLVPYTLANNSSPQAQEVAVETILSDDAPESSSDQVPASGRTTDRSGGTEFGLPPVWAPVTDSSEFPLGGSESIDCDGTNLDQSQLTSRLRRSRLLDKREKSFCTNPQQFERLKPASEPVPGRGRSQTKGPGPGEGSGQQPAYPEPEDGAIQELLGQVKGRLGKSNGALCPSSNFNYRIPICVQIFPIRFSPAAKVEPARLCKLIPISSY